MSHRRMATVVVWAVVAVLTSGCQLRVALDVEVEPDGAGRLAVAVTADPELLRRAAAAGADPLADLAATGGDLAADGWQTSDTVAPDGSRTVALSVAFADPAAFERLASDLAGALSAPEVALLEPLDLELTDEEVRLTGAASLRPTAAVADYGLTRRQAVALLRETDALDYVVSATLPGDVVSSTATARDGSTLRWVIGPGETVDIAAVATRPGSPIARGVLGAAAGGLAAAAALWALSRRRAARR